jgi:ATP-dependent Clp protease protease subunit
MIHQPLGGAQWQATEIAIAAQNILKRRKILNNILVKHTGQKLATIENDVERDNYMMPQDALKYWLIDKIIGEAIEYTK